jgi:hypothetical protein
MNHDKLVRDLSRAAVLIALSAAGGCANSTDGGGQPSGPHAPFIQVRADLTDETTNVGQGPFKVSYEGRLLDDTTLGDLAAQLSLRTWPEGAVVPTTLTINPVSASNNNVPGTTAVVQIAPSAALDDRWYSLQFGAAQKGITTSQSFDGGVAGVRLRPGSHPAVSLISFCQAEAAGSKFIVTLSEAVTAAVPAELFTVTQNGAALGCRFDEMRPQELHEFCATLVPGPLTVTLAAGKAQATGGAPLAPGTWSIDTSKLPVVQSACVGYWVGLTP